MAEYMRIHVLIRYGAQVLLRFGARPKASPISYPSFLRKSAVGFVVTPAHFLATLDHVLHA